MSRSYANVIRTVYESAWAIQPSQLAIILELVHMREAGVELTEDQIRERLEAVDHGERKGAVGARDPESPGYVAVLPIYGTILPRATLFSSMSGGASLDQLSRTFASLVDDREVKAIVLDVDSPGGSVAGVPEFTEQMLAARGSKPIVAVANYLAASAGYWIAASADELVMSPSAQVGSVGVYAAHQEISVAQEKAGVKTTLVSAGDNKVDGNPYEPLSDSARETIQAMVDESYGWFVNGLAKARGVSTKTVLADFGQGKVFGAEEAIDRGMADSVATLEQTITRVVAEASEPQRGRRGSSFASFASAALELVPVASGNGSATIGEGWKFETASQQFGMPVFVGSMGISDVLAAEGLPKIDVPADRRVQMEPHEEETHTMDTPTPTVAEPTPHASPRTTTAEQDELFGAIAGLKAAVDEMNAGRTDRESIEAMKEEILSLRAAADASVPRSGFIPDDVLEAVTGRGKRHLSLAQLHALPSRTAARVTGFDLETVAEFHDASDDLLLLAAATKKRPEELGFYADTFLPAREAAMDSTTAAEGDEWVPTVLSGNLIERVELALMVVALFPTVEMPSNPFDIPGFGVRTRGGRADEQTADTGQTGFRKVTPATRKITLTAVKFAAEALTSKEAEEDSIIPILPFLREELTSQLAVDQEDAVINGETTGSHMDSDVVAALDPRKNWFGLRKLAQAGAKTDASNAILTAAMLRANRKKMGKYGVRVANIAHILGIGQYINLLSDSNVITVDKYGPEATIKTGELAKVDGIPIIVSEYVRADLNATGVFDNVTTNRSIALTCNYGQHLIGNRRGVTVQLLQELYAEYDQDALTVSMRRAFAPRQLSTDLTIALTYNLAA